jgi:hypothetical protein
MRREFHKEYNLNNFVHAWELPIYVRLKKKFAKEIEKLILSNFSFSEFSRNTRMARNKIYAICRRSNKENAFTNVRDLYKVTDSLGLNRAEVEEQIEFIRDWNNSYTYKVNFPLYISPLHMRVVSHIVGDGSYSSAARWKQSNPTPMIKLIYTLTGRLMKKNSGSVTIPRFLVRAVCSCLGIHEKKSNSHEFVQASLKMPKEYRIEVLAAIVLDEGSVHDTIVIRMKDREIMKTVCNLIDSLGYDRSMLASYRAKKKFNGYEWEVKMWRVRIHVLGMAKFLKDLKSLVRKYGELAGLWRKQEKLETRLEKTDLKLAKSRKKNKILRKKLLKLFGKQGTLKTKDLIEILGIPRDGKAHWKMLNLMRPYLKRNIIRRVKYGLYELNKSQC